MRNFLDFFLVTILNLFRFNDGCINRDVAFCALSKLAFVAESQASEHSSNSTPNSSPSSANVSEVKRRSSVNSKSRFDVQEFPHRSPLNSIRHGSPSSPALAHLAGRGLVSSPQSPISSITVNSIGPDVGEFSGKKLNSAIFLNKADLQNGFILWFESASETIRWFGTLQNLSAVPLNEQKV